LLLRGANSYLLDEMERSVHDALCIVKRALESSSVVCGGGSIDVALAIHLDNYARTLATREQLAVKEFADALLVIPKTLANNAACDSMDLIAQLRTAHHAAQTEESKKNLEHYGLDLTNGVIRDNLAVFIMIPLFDSFPFSPHIL